MRTMYGRLTKNGINNWLQRSDARDYRDARYPQLRLRARKNRKSASVFMVVQRKGKAHWMKRAEFPSACIETVIAALPMALARYAEEAKPGMNTFSNCGQLTEWYLKHIDNSTVSPSWKAGSASVCKAQLSRLRLLPVALSFSDIDAHLVKPMLNADLAPAYVRLAVSVLKAAYSAAAKMRMIERDFLKDFSCEFSIKTSVAKSSSLVEADLPELFRTLSERPIPARVLFIMQLMFGMRISEIRQVRWEHIAGGFIYIPACNTKSRTEHRLPLTATALAIIDGYRAWQLKTKGKRAFLFCSGRGCISERTAQYWSADIRFKPFTSHDLRKLARTVLADLGTDTMVGERILNHALPVLLRTYVHTQLNAGMVNALEQYHQALLGKGLRNAITEIIQRSTLNNGSSHIKSGAGWL